MHACVCVWRVHLAVLDEDVFQEIVGPGLRFALGVREGAERGLHLLHHLLAHHDVHLSSQ